MKNAAVIVLFNPELNRLNENVTSIVKQVDILYLIDNHSEDYIFRKIEKEYQTNSKIILIRLSKNFGIGKAVNVALEKCKEKKISWLLTLDQDSVCPDNIVEEYSHYINLPELALICCVIDYNNLEKDTSNGNKYEYVSRCITSATYMNVDIACRLGGLDEKMFIDRVDFEYCFRVQNAGYKILRNNNVSIKHQLGDLQLFHFGKLIVHVGNHSAVRKYYMVRNDIYLHKKFPKKYNILHCITDILKIFFKTVLFENDNKIDKIKSILFGFRDGMTMRVN